MVGKPEVGSPEVRLRLSCGIQPLAPVGGKVQVAFGLLHFQCAVAAIRRTVERRVRRGLLLSSSGAASRVLVILPCEAVSSATPVNECKWPGYNS
jgi:hypothetical protein